jgi:hypothetical protein
MNMYCHVRMYSVGSLDCILHFNGNFSELMAELTVTASKNSYKVFSRSVPPLRINNAAQRVNRLKMLPTVFDTRLFIFSSSSMSQVY